MTPLTPPRSERASCWTRPSCAPSWCPPRSRCLAGGTGGSPVRSRRSSAPRRQPSASRRPPARRGRTTRSLVHGSMCRAAVRRRRGSTWLEIKEKGHGHHKRGHDEPGRAG